jgi:hypothetical protein
MHAPSQASHGAALRERLAQADRRRRRRALDAMHRERRARIAATVVRRQREGWLLGT